MRNIIELDKALITDDKSAIVQNLEKLNIDMLNELNQKELFMLSFSLWYLLAEWARISLELLESKVDEIQILFDITYSIAKERYKDDVDFKWLYGYMLSLFPEHFRKFYDYFEAETMGIEQIQLVSNQNPVAEALYHMKHNITSNDELIDSAKNYLQSLYSKDTYIYQYFKMILKI